MATKSPYAPLGAIVLPWGRPIPKPEDLVSKDFDPNRFVFGNGDYVPYKDWHNDVRINRDEWSKINSRSRWDQGKPSLNLIGQELLTMCQVCKPDDPLRALAYAALTQGDVTAYGAALDMLVEDGVLSEGAILSSRFCLALWQAGVKGYNVDRIVERLPTKTGNERMKLALSKGFMVVRDEDGVRIRIGNHQFAT